MHCVLGHLWRRGDRERDRWNTAVDLAVNGALLEAGFAPPPAALVDPKLKGMCAEEIYARLPASVFGAPYDLHLEPADPIPDRAPDRDHGAGVWKLRARQALSAARGQGDIASALERIVRASSGPRVDWRSLLAAFIVRSARSDYSWYPPNRRFTGRGFLLPSLRSYMGEAVVGLDTSGSISQRDLGSFVAEIRSIVATLPVRLTLLACDAEVHEMLTFDIHEPVEVPAVRGGGGTDFRPVFDRVEHEALRPGCLIYLTDGMGTYPEHEVDYPVLWAIRAESSSPEGGRPRLDPPWGMRVDIEAETEREPDSSAARTRDQNLSWETKG